MFDATHPDTLDTLARTLWAEARSEGRAGMEAVASVILNRAAHPRWWGSSVLTVCLKARQFSCWNADDPQHERIRGVGPDEPMFRLAQAVAAQAVGGHLEDATGGADSYANLDVCDPAWATRAARTAKIGRHTFFRVELPAPAPKPPVEHVILGAAPAPVVPPKPSLLTLILSLFRKRA